MPFQRILTNYVLKHHKIDVLLRSVATRFLWTIQKCTWTAMLFLNFVRFPNSIFSVDIKICNTYNF